MDTESNKVLLLGVGETGLAVVRLIAEKEVKGITAYGIVNESGFGQLTGNIIEEAELVLLVTDLGYQEEDSLALQAAKFAKENKKIVAAFLTTPPLFEGEKKIRRALGTAQEIGREVDTSFIINQETFNNRHEEKVSFYDLINSLVPEEERIADSIQNMMDLIAESGSVNIDLEDLNKTFAKSGTFAIECGFGAGENRIGLAIEQALSSRMMRTCDIFTSRKVLIKVLTPNNSPVTTAEMKIVSEFIDKFPAHADIKWGVGEADDDVIVSVIILVSGFDVKLPE